MKTKKTKEKSKTYKHKYLMRIYEMSDGSFEVSWLEKDRNNDKFRKGSIECKQITIDRVIKMLATGRNV